MPILFIDTKGYRIVGQPARESCTVGNSLPLSIFLNYPRVARQEVSLVHYSSSVVSLRLRSRRLFPRCLLRLLRYSLLCLLLSLEKRWSLLPRSRPLHHCLPS